MSFSLPYNVNGQEALYRARLGVSVFKMVPKIYVVGLSFLTCALHAIGDDVSYLGGDAGILVTVHLEGPDVLVPAKLHYLQNAHFCPVVAGRSYRVRDRRVSDSVRAGRYAGGLA